MSDDDKPMVEFSLERPPYDQSHPATKFFADYLHHGIYPMCDELTKDKIKDALGEFAKMKANCGTCIFFFRPPPIMTDAPEEAAECRRFPPQWIANRQWGQWPVVEDADWCGEHRPAADVERES